VRSVTRTTSAIHLRRGNGIRAVMVERGPAYRVRYDGADWFVEDKQGARTSERMRSQAEAVIHAKELARRDGSAQIIVHDQTDLVVSEFFYQRAEREPLRDTDDEIPSLAASQPARKK
jgi:hypothetical protein